MKLSCLFEDEGITYFHGISPDGDLVAHCQKIAQNGFRSGSIYVTPNLGMALSYRRDLDFDNPSDQDLRGVAEMRTPRNDALDGDIILEPILQDVDILDQHWPGLSSRTKQQWLLLNKLHAAWADFDEMPEDNYEYKAQFGDINLYDAAQKVADQASREVSNKPPNWPSVGNTIIQGPIKPIDVYIFKQIDDTDNYKCVDKLLGRGSVNVGDIHKIGARV